MLVNRQLVCLPPVGHFNHVMLFCSVFSSFGFIGPEKPHCGSCQLRYLFIYFIYLNGKRKGEGTDRGRDEGGINVNGRNNGTEGQMDECREGREMQRSGRGQERMERGVEEGEGGVRKGMGRRIDGRILHSDKI